MKTAHRKTAAGFLLLGLAVSLAATGCAGKKKKDTATKDKIFTVRQSDLSIGTLLKGAVNAKKKHKLAPEASYNNKLTWIEEENTFVNKGDTVIRFETQDLIDDIEERKISIKTKKESLEIALEEKRILLSENQSSLRSSSDSVESAKEDYARYYKYDGKNTKDGLVRTMESAAASLEDAEETYRDKMDEISNTIYDDEDDKNDALDDLEGLADTVDDREQSYEAAKYSLKIFKKYTYPNTLTSKKNSLEQAQLNHEKVLVSTASRVIQKDEQISRIKAEIRRLEEDLERIESYLPMMEITAPESGILIYGDVDRNRGNNTEIEVGMDCHRNQVLATIPEMNNLIVDFEIPEQFRHRVSVGSEVIISPPLPAPKIKGKVDDIAVVPVHRIRWDDTSPKIYNATIALDKQDEKLVSGMNVEIEIIDQVIKDSINIPVEAVFEEDGEYFVYLADGEDPKKAIVEIGSSNDKYVDITKGLKPGDQVYLYSPYNLDASE